MSEVDFVVHDITRPFPEQYHGRFDVVNLRFLLYALSEADLQIVVNNAAEILRPGGYLQRQEIDIIDVWATTSIKAARDAVISIVQKKIARSLNVSMPPQMVKALLSPRIQAGTIDDRFNSTGSDSSINVVSWNHDLFRISTLETMSTHEYGSAKVQAEKNAVGLAINCQLLSSGAARMRDVCQSVDEEGEKNRLIAAANRYEELAESIKSATNANIARWDADATWVVARKAMIVPLQDDWMGARRAKLANS